MATNKSVVALNIAQMNAQNLRINNIKFYQSDWFADLPQQKFAAIISNPPYIAANDTHLEQKNLQFEPQKALLAGETGLEAIQHIVRHAKEYLLKNGWLMLEHSYDQAEAMKSLLERRSYASIENYLDLSGYARVTCGEL